MPTATYDLIASTTLAASSSTVTFGSLPQTYRDLICVVNFSGSVYTGVRISINGSTSDFSFVQLYGAGSSAVSYSGAENQIASGFTGTTMINQFMDYSATDKHKTILTRAGYAITGDSEISAFATRWGSTSAISSFTLLATSGSFLSGSTFAIYGITS